MGQYTKHVFVCTFGTWCNHDGDTGAIVTRLNEAVEAAGLKGQVRINKSGCMNQCGHGPMVVVYPDNHWYAGVKPEDAEEIVATDIVGGQVVARLSYEAPPGDNKDLSRYPAEVVAAEQAKRQGARPA
ncbi:MAG: Ferredoxin, 2Fe-2S [Chloroflexi bacterium ADurb.Bin325]|nr:MAG: Ferredoxin, 2Fe-2S [Chloroflexi bacterium ADurb.Bin325]